jgi:hypothetical protein
MKEAGIDSILVFFIDFESGLAVPPGLGTTPKDFHFVIPIGNHGSNLDLFDEASTSGDILDRVDIEHREVCGPLETAMRV